MNRYTNPGPFGADTDDAVSALLDGELAGFAQDHGLGVASVKATLEQWRGLDACRARLLTARAALQAPLTLDETTRSAIVAAALAATADAPGAPTADAPVIELKARRRNVTRIVLGAAAAAFVLIAGLGGVLALQGSQPSGNTAADRPKDGTVIGPNAAGTGDGRPASNSEANTFEPGASGQPPTNTAPNAPLEDVADPDALRALVADRVGTAGPVGSPACPNLELFPPGASVVLRVPATFAGRPVEVSAATEGSQTVVFVVDPSTCSVLSVITL